MPTTLQAGLAAAALCTSLCAAGTAAAAPSSSDLFATGGTSGAGTLALVAAITSGQGISQPASDFLTQAVGQIVPVAATGPFENTFSFTQSRSALRNPLSSNLRGNSDLVLWNLVTMVRAQQLGGAFDVVDTGTSALQTPPTQTVSAVPLPGAVWLFVMGVLGLTGTRVTGLARTSAGAGNARPSASAWPSGAGAAVT